MWSSQGKKQQHFGARFLFQACERSCVAPKCHCSTLWCDPFIKFLDIFFRDPWWHISYSVWFPASCHNSTHLLYSHLRECVHWEYFSGLEIEETIYPGTPECSPRNKRFSDHSERGNKDPPQPSWLNHQVRSYLLLRVKLFCLLRNLIHNSERKGFRIV